MGNAGVTGEDGVSLTYSVTGAGSAVLLLHGFTMTSEMWRTNGVIAELEHRFRLIAPDLRGHGESDRPTDSALYGMSMVNDVAALLDAERQAAAHIVGFSMGAELALKFATLEPERVKSLMLIGSGWSGPEVIEIYHQILDDIREGRFASGPDLDIDVLAALVGAVHEMMEPPREPIERLTCPALGVVGDQDPERKYLERLVGAFPGFEVEVLPGTTHETSWQHDSIPNRVAAFLDAAESRAGLT